MADKDANGGDRGHAAAGTGCSSSSQNVPQEVTYRGVYKTWHRFSANVYGTPMRAYIGMYATPEEAAKAHDEAALERLGDKAILNFLPDGRLNPSRLAPRFSVRKSSTFKGVSATEKGWCAMYCAHAERNRYLGSFAGEEDAARAYDKYAKERDGDFAILNFLPNGSINPNRHHRIRARWCRAMAAIQSEGGVGNATVNTEQQEAGEDYEKEEDEEKEEEEEQQQKQKEEAEGRPHKTRRLNEDLIIDLTDDEPIQAIAPSAPRASTQMATPISVRAAASDARKETAAVGGGGPAASTQPLCLPTLPTPTSASASSVTVVEVASAPPAPLPLPPSVNVEASVAVPSSFSSSAAQSMGRNGLKMTLPQATALLGAEAFKRLATCEEGSEETASLERLMSLLQQLLREARGAHASSSSSALSDSSTADLRAFLLTFVCPKYTTEELKGNQLDNVIQMGLCAVKL